MRAAFPREVEVKVRANGATCWPGAGTPKLHYSFSPPPGAFFPSFLGHLPLEVLPAEAEKPHHPKSRLSAQGWARVVPQQCVDGHHHSWAAETTPVSHDTWQVFPGEKWYITSTLNLLLPSLVYQIGAKLIYLTF